MTATNEKGNSLRPHELKKYKAKASFVLEKCRGPSVCLQTDSGRRSYSRNHTHTFERMENNKMQIPEEYFWSGKIYCLSLFRPPYGRIKKPRRQKKYPRYEMNGKDHHWDILSGDFDSDLTRNMFEEGNIECKMDLLCFHDRKKLYAAWVLFAACMGVLSVKGSVVMDYWIPGYKWKIAGDL